MSLLHRYLRTLLFLREAEAAHDSALRVLSGAQASAAGRAWLRMLAGSHHASPVEAMGLRFAHPVGVAAGFDKDARVVLALQELGFAFVEVGTVTPRPQGGNARPRLWRFPEEEALVNALGFPGEGMEVVARRLCTLRESGLLKVPVGVNLGKNADTPLPDAARDCRKVLECLRELGDYFVLNVSSPNTPGLRDLQAVAHLRPLLAELAAAAAGKPLLVKLSPDLADEDVTEVARVVRESGVAGVVAANTSTRRALVPRAAALDRGGLSGAPLFARTREMLRLLRRELSSEQTLIASGGISRAARVRDCLALGANLVQVYTPFIYLGPRCVRVLLRDL